MPPASADNPKIPSQSPDRTGGAGDRRCAPAAERNTAPIISVLRTMLPKQGLALEAASGTGQHAAAFARAFPALTWQPSDLEPEALRSIEAWRQDAALDNLNQPLCLDVAEPHWPAQIGPSTVDAVLAINLIHIAPWETAIGLIAGSGEIMKPAGCLYLYGPFAVAGRHTAPSNAEFDRWLKSQNPDWGVRDLEEVEQLALAHGLRLEQRLDMPANNFSLILRKH